MRITVAVDPSWKTVALSPDDILELKLLHDCYRRRYLFRNTEQRGRRDVESENILETLERILKQVQ